MFKPPITTSDIKATDFKHSAYFVGLGLCCHREKVVSEAVFLRQKVARLICLAPGGCSNTHSGAVTVLGLSVPLRIVENFIRRVFNRLRTATHQKFTTA
jgi:hypothetical protein